MTDLEEVKRLRRVAADMVEQSERRDSPLSAEEDAMILRLLKDANELEHQIHHKRLRLSSCRAQVAQNPDVKRGN